MHESCLTIPGNIQVQVIDRMQIRVNLKFIVKALVLLR